MDPLDMLNARVSELRNDVRERDQRIETQIEHLSKKIDALRDFKSLVLGMALLISFLVPTGVECIAYFVKGHP